MCGQQPSDRLSMDSLYKCLGMASPATSLRSRYLRHFGHGTHSDSCINQCLNLEVVGKHHKGSCKTRDGVISENTKSWNFIKDNAVDKGICRGDTKSAAETSNPYFKEQEVKWEK